jgi:hypothetical protein
MHGWHPPEHNIHPELVIGSDGLSYQARKDKRFWVARQDQAAYLRRHGYSRVKAIGMPMVYLGVPSVSRLPGSLLVMPVHSLASTTHDWGFERYADEIYAVSHYFQNVVACVHPACIDKGYWVSSFRTRGIPVVAGADATDRNSLLRMALLFSQFEFVTSNGFGSHLVYAAYFGARPSLFGSIATYKAADFRGDTIYNNCPELLPMVLQLYSEESLRSHYAWLFCEPFRAGSCEEWSRSELGYENKVKPKELLEVILPLKRRIWWHAWGQLRGWLN